MHCKPVSKSRDVEGGTRPTGKIFFLYVTNCDDAHDSRYTDTQYFLSRCLEPLAAHMTDILRKVDFEDYGVLYCSIIKVKVSDVR